MCFSSSPTWQVVPKRYQIINESGVCRRMGRAWRPYLKTDGDKLEEEEKVGKAKKIFIAS